MLKLYFETAFIKVSYEEAWQLGVAEWKGFASSDDLRSAALRSLDFVNEYQVTRWLADRRKMKAIRQHDQQWTMEEFLPKVISSPLRRVANVVSEDIFNKMAMDQIIGRAGSLTAIEMRDFDNLPEAMEWLKQPLKEGALPEPEDTLATDQ
ncbi:STAS/SEC14 domain-containing protein [Pontibacter liquoris]|uniref:STAS/SEC14 domain-containing protein n=1 Tax=Pontibacter liquoris TaxID=2905677 RepID=UPI001FA7B823|nr:STAS/SEC14 domain-containing protein [Pontibacter liquoris]